jgi:hypothetical protein
MIAHNKEHIKRLVFKIIAIVILSGILTLISWVSGIAIVVIYVCSFFFGLPVGFQTGAGFVAHPIFGSEWFLPLMSWLPNLGLAIVIYVIIVKSSLVNDSKNKK